MGSSVAEELAGRRNALEVEMRRINGVLDAHAKGKLRNSALNDSGPLIQKLLSDLEDVTARFRELADECDRVLGIREGG